MVVRVGIDTGGTFTDLMAWSDDGEVTVVKVSSTPDDDARALLEGIGQLGAEGGFAPGDVASIAHGTTVALNAVLQRRFAPIGLLVTHGYRDMIEIARQTVPGDWGAIYTWVKPPRVVPLENVYEVRERISHTGEVLEELDESSVREAAAALRDRGIDAMAICFLHSYAAGDHEARAREIVLDEHPGCLVTISSEVLPELREYERAMTTCLNAVLMPLVSEYLEQLSRRLHDKDYEGPLLMMKSVGGLARHDKVNRQPIAITYSGPSAGVLGMAWLARRLGEDRVLTYDMGGTSTDVAVIEGGRPVLTTDGLIDIYPMRTPMIDLVSIGAGGGSIATLGTGNRLRVGPESAGANPGPICYGRGGTEPTTTDANLVLGRIPTELLGGGLKLDVDAARAAIAELGEKLGLGVEEAAYGILEIAAFNMAGAVRQVSVKRGRDPRDYALFAYGGAGPLHAAQLASLLSIDRIVVPRNPGLGSCIGLLAGQIHEDAARTVVMKDSALDADELTARYGELEARARTSVTDQGVPEGEVVVERFADMRYIGTTFELTVTVPAGTLDATALEQAIAAFHEAHQAAFGYSYAGEQPVEIVNIRATATAGASTVEPRFDAGSGGDTLVGERTVYFGPDEGFQACAIHDRARITPGFEVAGPAIVEQYDSTVLIPPNWTATVEEGGNIIMVRSQA